VTPNERKPRSRILIPLLVAALGIALGAGGIALLRPLDQAEASRLAATSAAGAGAAKPLSQAAVRARIEPSVVDVTAALTYDDETASGTGFVVDSADDLILTNNHVIRDATAVTVTVPSTGMTYPARIVGVDVPADIAILQISPAAQLPGAPLGDSADLASGAPVISFGNLAGAGGTPTVAAGVIGGTGRTIEANDGASGFSEVLHGMLATTARIAPGDSGGPLASSSGTVIGVDTAAGTGTTATGYAIPINAALAAERQITKGHAGNGITRGTAGFLGVVVSSGSARSLAAQRARARGGGTQTAAYVTASSPVTAASPASTESCVGTADAARPPAAIAPAHAGALVAGVLCGTGAAAAGIAAGDVITAADGRPVASAGGLAALMSKCDPGTVISVTWASVGGRSRTALIRLTSAPAV
jgi:S1-C subfamily serine protease